MKPVRMSHRQKILVSASIFFMIVLTSLESSGQNKMRIKSDSILKQHENQLEVLMLAISSTQGKRRMELNREFQLKFGQALKIDNAHSYSFNKLVAVSRLSSRDLKIRVFTWEIDDSEGNIQYFGFISSHRSGEHPVVFKLTDKSRVIEQSEYAKCNAEKWYGALYYELRTVETKKSTYYVVLGINRRNNLVKERIVDVIYVDDEVYFGKEVFNTGKRIFKKRLVYRHSSETDMTLNFESGEVIVVDHLIPSSPVYHGKPEYYVPDLSYDAFTLKKGIWNYSEDYNARLDKNTKDKYYEMDLLNQEKVY